MSRLRRIGITIGALVIASALLGMGVARASMGGPADRSPAYDRSSLRGGGADSDEPEGTRTPDRGRDRERDGRGHRAPTATATATATPALPQLHDLSGSISLLPEYAIVDATSCTPGIDAAIQSRIPADQFVDGTGGLSYPTVGQVAIFDATNTFLAPVIAGGADGQLSYLVPQVPAGTYTLAAFLYYHHPLDASGVMRVYSMLWANAQLSASLTVDIPAGADVRQDLQLRLNGDVCAIP